jgi:hypothetical protein
MIGDMIMEDLDGQGALEGTNIIIPHGTQPEENMHIQGQQSTQVFLL